MINSLAAIIPSATVVGDKIIFGDWQIICTLTGKVHLQTLSERADGVHVMVTRYVPGTCQDAPSVIAGRVRGYLRSEASV